MDEISPSIVAQIWNPSNFLIGCMLTTQGIVIYSSLSFSSLETSICQPKNSLHNCMCHIKHLGNTVCSALISYCCSTLVLLGFKLFYLYARLCLVTWLMCCYSAHRFTRLICCYLAHMSLLGSYVFTWLICLCSTHMYFFSALSIHSAHIHSVWLISKL